MMMFLCFFGGFLLGVSLAFLFSSVLRGVSLLASMLLVLVGITLCPKCGKIMRAQKEKMTAIPGDSFLGESGVVDINVKLACLSCGHEELQVYPVVLVYEL